MPKQKNWITPLNIPEGQINDYKIVHDMKAAGEEVQLNSSRNALFGGQRGKNTITYPYETKWHKLEYDGGTWMTDYPVEQRQIDDLIPALGGQVLVGGLGIGYVATQLAQNKNVDHFVVVEKSPEVIELVWQHLDLKGKGSIVQADLHDYLKSYNGPRFDTAFYDIWQSDGESTFFLTVVPLLKESEGKVINRPLCWNEDVMRGQLYYAITGRLALIQNPAMAATIVRADKPLTQAEVLDLLISQKDDPFLAWSSDFFQWYKDTSPDDGAIAAKVPEYIRKFAVPEEWQ